MDRERWLIALNSAINTIELRVDSDVARQATVTIISSTSGVQIPYNWKRIVRCLTPGWAGVRSMDAVPDVVDGSYVYWQRGDKLYFGLDGAEVQFLVQLDEVPYLMDDGDELPFPPQYHILIVRMAVLQIIAENNYEPRPDLQLLVERQLDEMCKHGHRVSNATPAFYDEGFEFRRRYG